MIIQSEKELLAHSPARGEDWLERAGFAASMLCLAHCLALPLLFAALPSLTASFNVPESFHLWVLAFAVPASGVALVTGRARHGSLHPLVLGVVGLVLLAVGVMVFGATHWETPVTVTGSILLATAHVRNWRLRHLAGLHDHG
jgi:hypothetical protein